MTEHSKQTGNKPHLERSLGIFGAFGTAEEEIHCTGRTDGSTCSAVLLCFHDTLHLTFHQFFGLVDILTALPNETLLYVIPIGSPTAFTEVKLWTRKHGMN